MRSKYQIHSSSTSKWTSNKIRSTFIEYFQKHDHQFVKSSSVIPRKNDGTYFVNAGMNQFKNRFLDTHSSDSYLGTLKRAVNSQKCIRVGGKHNDLDDVGIDLRHHTFFEMLGSWSFGDYFKEKACILAWNLLTNVYKISPDQLYVTYFGGSIDLNLPPDLECLEIWSKLGIPQDRILPFGIEHNFWEMGENGPCGPCTEIHYDYKIGRYSPDLVNTNNDELIELWNIVFIQYNKQPSGNLIALIENHVDTGMGLERLTSVLQGVTSNYDTDLFTPIFDHISKNFSIPPYTGKTFGDFQCDLDIAYRKVADHMRMATVSLSDGLMPDRKGLGSKLQNVIYRAVNQSESVLKLPFGSLSTIIPIVLNTLKDVFPDINKNQNELMKLIDNVEEDYLRKKDIGRQCIKLAIETIQPKTAQFNCKEMIDIHEGKYGRQVSRDILKDVFNEFEIDGQWLKFDGYINSKINSVMSPNSPRGNIKLDQKEINFLKESNIIETNDSSKYQSLNNLSTRLLAIYKDKEFVNSISGVNAVCGFIFNHSSFYSESGGQIADIGQIISDDGISVFKVMDVQKTKDYVLHYGKILSGEFSINSTVNMQISESHRHSCSRAHTATHILNYALNKIFGNMCYQRGSYVSEDKLSFDFYSSAKKIKLEELECVETIIGTIINESLPVVTMLSPLNEAFKIKCVKIMEDEDYPETVRIIAIGQNLNIYNLNTYNNGDISAELCGGTHVNNTKDIEDIVITNLEGQSQGLKRVIAVTGSVATMARKNAAALLERYNKLQGLIIAKKDVETIENERDEIVKLLFNGPLLPKITRDQLNGLLEKLQHTVLNKMRKNLKKSTYRKLILLKLEESSSSRKDFATAQFKYGNARDIVKILSECKPMDPVLVFSEISEAYETQQCVCYVPENHPWFTAREIGNEVCRIVGADWRLPTKYIDNQSIIVMKFSPNSYDKVLNTITELFKSKGKKIYR